MLDGKVPEGGQEPTVHDHPENLFTLLGNRYEMRVSEEATNLRPARLCERPNDRGATARLTLLVDDASVVYGHLVLGSQRMALTWNIGNGSGRF
jgi:hypothetical protein